MNREINKDTIMVMPSLERHLEDLQATADHAKLSVDELCAAIIAEWLDDGEDDVAEQDKQ